MIPRKFLWLSGIILTDLGVLGMIVLGPTKEASVLGDKLWLDTSENYIHLFSGVVALLAHFIIKNNTILRGLTFLIGVIFAAIAILGFMNLSASIPNLLITNLEYPWDHILYISLSLWAFWVGFFS